MSECGVGGEFGVVKIEMKEKKAVKESLVSCFEHPSRNHVKTLAFNVANKIRRPACKQEKSTPSQEHAKKQN